MSNPMPTPPRQVNGPPRRDRRLSTARAGCAALVVGLALWAGSPARAAVAPKLRDALQSTNTKVRVIAIAGVARTGDPEAPPLLRALLTDPDAIVRAAAVDGLVALKDVAAIQALVAMRADRDAAVRASVERALPALQALVTVLAVPDVEDLSDRSIPGLAPLLQDGFDKALRAALPPGFEIRRGAADKGYGLLVKLRAIRRGMDGGDGFIEPKCDVTVVELPAQALRFASSAAAAAAVSGPVPPSMERELASDGIAACAPSLAKDVVDFLKTRRR
jgi:hypothetical protein